MSLKYKVRTVLGLIDDAINITASGADWEVIYDLVFNLGIGKEIRELGLSLDYYDPDTDTSYEEDVLAYVNALKSLRRELEKIAASL